MGWEDDEWRRASIIGNFWQEVPAQRPARADLIGSGLVWAWSPQPPAYTSLSLFLFLPS